MTPATQHPPTPMDAPSASPAWEPGTPAEAADPLDPAGPASWPAPSRSPLPPLPSGRRPAVAGRDMDTFLRNGLSLLALGVLAAAVVIAFVALMDIVRIWFEHQYVPIARAVLAGIVALVAFRVLRMLAPPRR
jgi:hypothetical protein